MRPLTNRGKIRLILTHFALGLILGMTLGVLLGILWVSVDWIITVRAGSSPSSAWVKYIYTVGATIFGVPGAILGAIIGGTIGIAKSTSGSA